MITKVKYFLKYFSYTYIFKSIVFIGGFIYSDIKGIESPLEAFIYFLIILFLGAILTVSFLFCLLILF
jgi:hypothetical protein